MEASDFFIWELLGTYFILEMFILNTINEFLLKNDFQAFIDNRESRESESKLDIFSVLCQINQCIEDCLDSISNNTLFKKTGCCYGDWVAVDHIEAFLEDRVLRFRRRDLLFAMVVH